MGIQVNGFREKILIYRCNNVLQLAVSSGIRRTKLSITDEAN